MPIDFADLIEHAREMPDPRVRIEGVLRAIRSRLNQVTGRDELAKLADDLDQHHDALVGSAVGDGTLFGQRAGRLGAGETPLMPGDRAVSAIDSERHSNPLAPYDSSGHKVHPSEALTLAQRTDPKAAAGFGGSGMGLSADVRNQAGRAIEQNRNLGVAEQQLPAGTQTTRDAQSGKLIPVTDNPIVPGSERTVGGIKYVTKRKPDGSTYDVVDNRPDNGPV